MTKHYFIIQESTCAEVTPQRNQCWPVIGSISTSTRLELKAMNEYVAINREVFLFLNNLSIDCGMIEFFPMMLRYSVRLKRSVTE